MKVLTKDRIVESVKFPLSEALTFSILLWTVWGLFETFYWQKLAGIVNPAAPPIDSYLYIASFLLYLAIATVLSILLYALVKLGMVILKQYEPFRFRGVTLTLILASFFGIVLSHYLPEHIWKNHPPDTLTYVINGVIVLFAIVLIFLFYHWASGVDFRIPRSGTLMLSVLVISLLLSFVNFPIFSEKPKASRPSFHFSEIHGIRKITAYRCMKPFFPRLAHTSSVDQK